MNDIRDRLDREWKAIEDRDAEAKAAGRLIGRYIKEQAADSFAIYRIIENDHQLGTVTVEHLNYCDGWTIPMIESMGRVIPIKYAKENIAQRESLNELFSQ